MTGDGSVLTIAGALRGAADALRASGVEEPRREAVSLLSHALGRDRAFLVTHSDESLTAEQLRSYLSTVERRAAGEPLQYIKGSQEFYGLDFEVNENVLIPRPETELLVETALELLKDTRSPLVCDVGTGSGCIAVSLLHERREARAPPLGGLPAALGGGPRHAQRQGGSARGEIFLSARFDARA